MHANQVTDQMLQTKHISGYNRETLKLTMSLINDSVNQLRQASYSICSLSSHTHSFSNQSTVNNLILRNFLPQKSMLVNLTSSLNNFIKAHLPGRKRLSVAIGISSFVKSQKPYTSFAQPLVEAIIELFHHLEYQSNVETTLLHFISFQNSFVKTCDKILEINKLISFGPRFSSISFSQLLTTNEFLFLQKDLINNLPMNLTSFRKARIAHRIINKSRFKVSENSNNSCSEAISSCWCTSRIVTIYIPRVPAYQKCLTQASSNRNKFIDKSSFYYLSDANQMSTVSKGNAELGGGSENCLIRILNPPLIRVKNGTKAMLTSEMSIYFPEKINDTIFSFCEKKNRNRNLTINQPGLLRIYPDCNYTSSKNSIFIRSYKAKHFQIAENKRDLFKNITFLMRESSISSEVFSQIEKKFENALSGEDQIQVEVKSLAAQSWLMGWAGKIVEYFLPSISVITLIVLAPMMIYICKCLPTCKRIWCCWDRNTTDRNDLVTRVEKLETFFSYFVTTGYHDLNIADIHGLDKSSCEKDSKA